jgi:hypothetical protein
MRPRSLLLACLAVLASPLLACGAAKAPASSSPASVASPSASSNGAAAAASSPKRRVVLVSIDGLRPEYLREADARGEKIPNLRKLVAEGAIAEAMDGTWPTVTYPAHTTLVTGVAPNTHGIVSNHPFDPKLVNDDGWYWYAPAIKVPTLWNAAHGAGLHVASVYWPVTVGAPDIDWNFPQFWRTKTDFDDALMRALATPGLADEVERAYGVLPAEHRGDHERGNAGEYLIKTRKPDLALVYFTDLDTVQHATGPFSRLAYSTLEAIDAEVGRLVKAAADAGTLAETTFVVVSDHGFATIHEVVRPLSYLRARRLVQLDDRGRIRSWEANVMTAGGSCGVYLARPDDAALKKRVRGVLDDLVNDAKGGIAKIHEGADVAALGGFEGATWVLEATEGFAFSGAPDGDTRGTTREGGAHGYPPTLKAMRASFVAWGAHVHAGQLGVVRMIDVAPSVARWLGVTLPKAEGKAIEAAISP